MNVIVGKDFEVKFIFVSLEDIKVMPLIIIFGKDSLAVIAAV